MGGELGRHAELAAELGEWWEDVWQADTSARVVLVRVPAGWGRSTVLDRFEAGIASREDAPVTLTVRINGQELPSDPALQAQVLRACLAGAARRHRMAERLGLEELSGQAQLGLGVGGLFFSGLAAGVAFLLAGGGGGAAGKAWDGSPAGQDGALARTARAVAAVSVSAPVAVIIDDADCLDAGLAVTMVDNLIGRHDSQVLIIAMVDPASFLPAAITARVRNSRSDRLVHNAEADPDMGYEPRLELARQLCPSLADAAARRIAQRTATFGEVFIVTAAPGLAGISPNDHEGKALTLVDKAVNARLARPAPSREAGVIAWAGGLVHVRQADRALGILGTTRTDGDPDVRRWEALERLTDPATSRMADQVAADLGPGERRALAAAFLTEALTIAADPQAGLIDMVAALQAAHRVRHHLPDCSDLPRAQCELVAALEALGDQAAAVEVAAEALAGWPAEAGDQGERDALEAAKIRLTYATSPGSAGPLAEQLIAEAAAGGAAIGLEARIWASIVLLDTPEQRDAALTLAGQAGADLDALDGLGMAGDRWRLLLAYHVGRAGLPDLATRLLTPLISSDDPARQDAATVVQRAVDGPGADIRLQNILLEDELGTLPPEADDERLRVHHALAANYAILGDYRQALTHGHRELGLRSNIQGRRHPDTLTARYNITDWTSECGAPAEALRMFEDLLPDVEQVLGSLNPLTLATRGFISRLTGYGGDVTSGLRLARELLPDLERALGGRDPFTLANRANIALLTGQAGNKASALRLYWQLLPDQEQILGSRDPDTLATRGNIAYWTGECGDMAAALRLYRDLLPDLERALGPRHPDSLTVRGHIASLTGRCGAVARALRLYRDLLPDQERALGPRHPETLTVRGNIAFLTARCGDAAGALRLYRDLLPDIEQAFGSGHPGVLRTRAVIARLSDEI